MKIALTRFLAGCLKIAINILPNPDGSPRPPSEAERVNQRDPSRARLPRSMRTLDYRISKAEMTRIFQLGSSYYIDSDPAGPEIRTLVGEVPVLLDGVHGHGNTSVWRQSRAMDIYVNQQTGSSMSYQRGLVKTIANTFKHLPTALIHAKKAEGFGRLAARHEMPGRCCDLIVVGRLPRDSQTPKHPVFGFHGTFLDGKDNHTVILHDVFAPVADPASGEITGMVPIRKSENAPVDVLRTLIFCKLVTDQMRDKKAPDLKACFAAVQSLPLTAQSKLKDYLTYHPPEIDGP